MQGDFWCSSFFPCQLTHYFWGMIFDAFIWGWFLTHFCIIFGAFLTCQMTHFTLDDIWWFFKQIFFHQYWYRTPYPDFEHLSWFLTPFLKNRWFLMNRTMKQGDFWCSSFFPCQLTHYFFGIIFDAFIWGWFFTQIFLHDFLHIFGMSNDTIYFRWYMTWIDFSNKQFFAPILV